MKLAKYRIFEIYDTKLENECWFKDIKKQLIQNYNL